MSGTSSRYAVAFLAVLAFFMIGIPAASAHQPRLVDSDATVVVDPEISKAYYGELRGAPAVFSFYERRSFRLYAGLLAPDIRDARTDLTLEVRRNGGALARFDGAQSRWSRMHEPFAGDDYLKGPEYALEAAPPGQYEILVSGPENRGRYALAVGDVESYPLGEILNAYKVIPGLKSGFFNKLRATFLFSIFGSVEFILLLAAGALFGFLYRRLLKLTAEGRKAAGRNIGRFDRRKRLGLALIALAAGLGLWNPLLLFIAGFIFFEAAAGWCALYAAIGRNTCPVG